MPISEDLKSVHVALAAVARSASPDKEAVIRLACANILSLSEQVEALENIPMTLPPDVLRNALVQPVPLPVQ